MSDGSLSYVVHLSWLEDPKLIAVGRYLEDCRCTIKPRSSELESLSFLGQDMSVGPI